MGEGAQGFDRLIDAAHAYAPKSRRRQRCSRSASGWLVAPEGVGASNHFGDRGRVRSPRVSSGGAGLVLVVEVKSALPATSRMRSERLDVKARLGRSLAESTGWTGAYGIVPAFVFAEWARGRNRRVIANHEALFARLRFAAGPRPWRGLGGHRHRGPPSGLLWFTDPCQILARGERYARQTSPNGSDQADDVHLMKNRTVPGVSNLRVRVITG